jgi:hypothetical protein
MSEDDKVSYDASFVITFDALDLEDAEERLDDLFEELHDQGFYPNGVATIEEAIQIA